MTYSQVLKIVHQTGLTPEKAAKYFGLSGMTLRRWKEKDPRAEVPELYLHALREGCHRLISEGLLDPENTVVREFLQEGDSAHIRAVVHALGLPPDFSASPDCFSHAPLDEQWILGLSQIGIQSEKQKEVQRSTQKLENFQKLGKEWKSRIAFLLRAIRSSQISNLDKLVAFGALFYLITPFDFIPDHIPVFGLMDDFAVLGLATSFYASKFGDIFS